MVPLGLTDPTPEPVLAEINGKRSNEALAYHIFDLKEALKDANADKATIRQLLNGKLE